MMCGSRWPGRGPSAGAVVGYGRGGGGVGGGGRRSQVLLIFLSLSSIASLGLLLQQQWARRALNNPRHALRSPVDVPDNYGISTPKVNILVDSKFLQTKTTDLFAKESTFGDDEEYKNQKNPDQFQYKDGLFPGQGVNNEKTKYTDHSKIHENLGSFQYKTGLNTKSETNNVVHAPILNDSGHTMQVAPRDLGTTAYIRNTAGEVAHHTGVGVAAAVIDLRQGAAASVAANNHSSTQHRILPGHRRWPWPPKRPIPTAKPNQESHKDSLQQSSVTYGPDQMPKTDVFGNTLQEVDGGNKDKVTVIPGDSKEDEYGVIPNPKHVLYLDKLRGASSLGIRKSDIVSHHAASETIKLLDGTSSTALIYDYKRASYYQWRNTKDECANYPTRFLARGSRSLVPLVSYPGSGNTWLRYIIEAVTGVFTGSVYHDEALAIKGFLGERDGYREGTTLVQKTHSLPLLPEELVSDVYNGVDFRFVVPLGHRRVVLLLRSPWESLLALRHFHHAGHTGFANPAVFRGPDWQAFTEERSVVWVRLYTTWLNLPNTSIHVVHYEHLLNNLDKESERLLEFLGLPIDYGRIECLLRYSQGRFRRPKYLRQLQGYQFSNTSSRTLKHGLKTINLLLQKGGHPTIPEHLFGFNI